MTFAHEIYVTVHTKSGKFELTSDEWMQFDDSQLHCVDGPAVKWANRIEEWFFEGKRHRVGGPARIARVCGSLSREYYLNGKYFENSGSYWKEVNEIRDLPLELRLLDPRWWVREPNKYFDKK